MSIVTTVLYYVLGASYIYQLVQHRREVARWRRGLATFGESNVRMMAILERQAAILSEHKR